MMPPRGACLPPGRPDTGDAPFMCRCFGHQWEFREACCYIVVECSRCRQHGMDWKYRSECPKERHLSVNLTADVEGFRSQIREALEALSSGSDKPKPPEFERVEYP